LPILLLLLFFFILTNDQFLVCFVLFDRKSDGVVDREELHTMLTSLYTLCNNPNPQKVTHSSAAHPNRRSAGSILTQSSNGITQLLMGSASSMGLLAQSDGVVQAHRRSESAPPAPVVLVESAAPAPDPAQLKAPASEPEKERGAPDYASEVAFFVDMLFKIADVNRDGVLSPDEFREAALMHPFILKTFYLDRQHNSDIRISI
jgi:hypothetical protein